MAFSSASLYDLARHLVRPLLSPFTIAMTPLDICSPSVVSSDVYSRGSGKSLFIPSQRGLSVHQESARYSKRQAGEVVRFG